MYISVVSKQAALAFICIVVLYMNLMISLEIKGDENIRFEESSKFDLLIHLLILQTKVES